MQTYYRYLWIQIILLGAECSTCAQYEPKSPLSLAQLCIPVVLKHHTLQEFLDVNRITNEALELLFEHNIQPIEKQNTDAIKKEQMALYKHVCALGSRITLSKTLLTWLADETHHAAPIDSVGTFTKIFSSNFLQNNGDWLVNYLRTEKIRDYRNMFIHNLSSITVQQSKELVENQTACITNDGALIATIVEPALVCDDNYWQWYHPQQNAVLASGFPSRYKSIWFTPDDSVFIAYHENCDADYYAIPRQAINIAFSFEQLYFLSYLNSANNGYIYKTNKPDLTTIEKLQQWKEKLYNDFQSEERSIIDKILKGLQK